MKEIQYVLSDGLNIYGPFFKAQILEMLRLGQIGLSIHCQTEGSTDWTALYLHQDFLEVISKFPKVPPLENVRALPEQPDWVGELTKFNQTHSFSKTEGATSEMRQTWADPPEKTWELKIGKTILGPYKFLKMLKLIRMGDLREYDLVRKTTEEEWHEANSVFEFSSDHLIHIDDPIVKELLERNIFRRQQNRKDYRGAISVYNGKDLFHLECVDLSLGGVAFFSSPPLFTPKKIILLRFEEISIAEGYHAKAQVVRAEKVLIGKDNPIFLHRYAVQFMEITPSMKKWISKFLSADG